MLLRSLVLAVVVALGPAGGWAQGTLNPWTTPGAQTPMDVASAMVPCMQAARDTYVEAVQMPSPTVFIYEGAADTVSIARGPVEGRVLDQDWEYWLEDDPFALPMIVVFHQHIRIYPQEARQHTLICFRSAYRPFGAGSGEPHAAW